MKKSQHQRPIGLITGAIAGLGFLALLLFRSSSAIEGALAGLKLSANVVVPSLFPFFVLSSLCVSMGYASLLGDAAAPVVRRVFRLPGEAAAPIVLGLLGGYPMGAKTVASLYERGSLNQKQAQYLLLFCNNSGPAFIFGVIGSCVFSSPEIGLAIYLIHMASALIIGVLLRPKILQQRIADPKTNNAGAQETMPFYQAFTNAVRDAGLSLLAITAFVTFFNILLALLEDLPLYATMPVVFKVVLSGLLELSTGVTKLSGSGLPLALQLGLAAAIVSWGGFCVHFQTLSVIPGNLIPLSRYFLSKLCHGLLAFALAFCWSLVRYPQGALQTAAWPIETGSADWQIFSLFFLLYIALFLLAKIFLLITSRKTDTKRL